jgi:HK97 family phage prohead protease
MSTLQSEEVHTLTLTAAAQVDGKETKRPRVSGCAYSGKAMRVGWWEYPVIVAVDGIEFAEQIPLLMNHDNSTDARIGIINASVEENQLMISGEIFSETEEARNVVEQMKAGADWQMSIGADVKEWKRVEADQKETVNGIECSGPLIVVLKSTLREVSVVAVGADASTNMKIEAKLNLTSNRGENPMPDEKKPAEAIGTNNPAPAPVEASITQTDVTAAALSAVKAERERVAQIKEICAGEFPEIEAKAIADGIGIDEVRTQVLAAFRKKEPQAAPNIAIHSNATDAKTIEAALALRAGVGEAIMLKAYGEQVVEAAAKNCDISLKETMIECLKIEGKDPGRTFGNDTIEAAFSSVSLPGILNNVANKKLLQAFTAQPIIATRLCSTGDLNDFKESERYRLTDVGDLKQVAQDGEIQDGGLTEEKAVNKLETYAKKFCLTRQMIINDDLGAFMRIPTAMGNRAARLIDQLFFKRLLANPTQSDGNALFHSAHGNLLTGADSAFGVDSLQEAIGKFLDQVDADGQPISVEPRFLLVPTALKFKALELTKGTQFVIAGDTNTVRPALNAIADENLQVVSSPYLANSAYSGYSTTAWYLFGDPSQVDTFEIGYLNGKRTPTIERGETDFNTLGMWFRVYFDLGIREQGHRGIVKANGAA